MISIEDLKKIDQRTGVRLRQLRLRRNLSQEDLAEKLGISFQQLQKYESGKNRISVSRLMQICKALRVPVSEMLGDEPQHALLAENSASQSALQTAVSLEKIAAPAVRKHLDRLIFALAQTADAEDSSKR